MKPFTATAKKIALATAVAITATSLTGLSEACASSNIKEIREKCFA